MVTAIQTILFFALFVGLCIVIINAIAFLQIWRKSYKPRNSLVLISFLAVLILINSFFAIFSGSSFINDIRSENQPNATSVPNSTQQNTTQSNPIF